MNYRLEFKPRVNKDLKALSVENQARIVEKIEALAENLSGDVKKLTNFAPQYRLRVGDYRVLFQIAGELITVFRVVHRRDAYR